MKSRPLIKLPWALMRNVLCYTASEMGPSSEGFQFQRNPFRHTKVHLIRRVQS